METISLSPVVPFSLLLLVGPEATFVAASTPMDVTKDVGIETGPVPVVIIGISIQWTSFVARVPWTEMVRLAWQDA